VEQSGRKRRQSTASAVAARTASTSRIRCRQPPLVARTTRWRGRGRRDPGPRALTRKGSDRRLWRPGALTRGLESFFPCLTLKRSEVPNPLAPTSNTPGWSMNGPFSDRDVAVARRGFGCGGVTAATHRASPQTGAGRACLDVRAQHRGRRSTLCVRIRAAVHERRIGHRLQALESLVPALGTEAQPATGWQRGNRTWQ
jgi:hypothetical protein